MDWKKEIIVYYTALIREPRNTLFTRLVIYGSVHVL